MSLLPKRRVPLKLNETGSSDIEDHSSKDIPTNSNMNVVAFFLKRPIMVGGFFLAIVLLGFVSLIGLPVNLLPKLTLPILQVSTEFAGATPSDVERRVSKVVEDAVASADGASSVTSSSYSGFSSVVVNFRDNINIDAAANDLSQRVQSIRDSLPSGAKAPTVEKFDPGAEPILTFAVTQDGASLLETADWVNRNLKPVLARVAGVAQVRVSGAPKREIIVGLDTGKLQATPMTTQQVAQAIFASAPDVAVGRISSGSQNADYASRNILSSVSDIENLLIEPASGLHLSDIATVRDQSATATGITRVNGESVILVSIRKSSTSNTVTTSRDTKAALQSFAFPKGIGYKITTDNAQSIQGSVDDTAKEAWITAIVVALVCLVALGKPNTALAVVLAIPISLAAAPLVFQLLGFSLNIISLLALIVAMGIVVDDSIVVAENVERYHKMGLPMYEAVLRGTSEIFSAVSAATWSLLAVLLPISFLPGLVGQIFKEFGLGLAAAIFFSWLEAIFFLTVRMAYTPEAKAAPRLLEVLASPKSSALWAWQVWRKPLGIIGLLVFVGVSFSLFGMIGLLGILAYIPLLAIFRYVTRAVLAALGGMVQVLHNLSEGIFTALSQGYVRTLEWSLKRSWLILLGAGLFFASLLVVLPQTSFVFTPKQDDGAIGINIRLPEGTSLAETDRVVQQAEQNLKKNPALEWIQSDTSSGSSYLSVQLLGKNQRESLDAFLPKLRLELSKVFQPYPEVEWDVSSLSSGGNGNGSDLSINVQALDNDVLTARMPQILETLRANPAVASVRSSFSDTNLERIFVPNPAQLVGTGLTAEQVSNTLQSFVDGVPAGNLRDRGENIPIRIKPLGTLDESRLLAMPIFAPTLASNLPLSDLGAFQIRQAPATISRSNKSYSATLYINKKPSSGDILKLQTSLEGSLKSKKLLDDQVKLGSSGDFSDADLLGKLLIYGPIALALAALLNFLVLASQFNSLRYPIYLLIPAPLAMTGAIWTLYFFGVSMDVIAILGMAILIGLAAKNAILLLEFVLAKIKQGLELKTALLEAARVRLRPILMTTLTIIAISIPLIWGGGTGAELRLGLGIVILGGVISSTFLTLFVIPAAFYTFERKRLERKEKTVIQDVEKMQLT